MVVDYWNIDNFYVYFFVWGVDEEGVDFVIFCDYISWGLCLCVEELVVIELGLKLEYEICNLLEREVLVE